jgi:hypothetical protein
VDLKREKEVSLRRFFEAKDLVKVNDNFNFQK